MSKYLKLFETTSDYETYISGSDVVLPNVSVAKDAPTTVYYKPVPPMNIITYKAAAKLTEAINPWESGLRTNAFSGKNGQLTITSHTFENNIGTIEFDGDVIGIGSGAFSGCKGLTSITIPDSVTSIGGSAFSSCTSLTRLNSDVDGLFNIPGSVTSIGSAAFSWCTSLTSIVVDSANTVYDSRNNCNAIINTLTNELIAGCKNTIIPNSVTSIGNGAFSGCSSLTNITIPDSVTSIGSDAFGYCSGLTSVTIPDSVTSIGSDAFNGCKGLTSITIPDSVTSIDYWAFSGCSGLTSITIGSGVTNIGNRAFYNCSNLTSITCNATTAPTINIDTFQDVKTGGTLTVPNGNTGYDVWMGTGDFYLGKYNWTKVEQ